MPKEVGHPELVRKTPRSQVLLCLDKRSLWKKAIPGNHQRNIITMGVPPQAAFVVTWKKKVSQDAEDTAPGEILARHMMAMGHFWSSLSTWKGQLNFNALGQGASKTNAGERQSLPPPASVCFPFDIKSTSHLCLPFLLLPGRAVLAVCIFKCYNDPDSKEAGGDPGSRFLFVSAHAVSYELLKWIEIKT